MANGDPSLRDVLSFLQAIEAEGGLVSDLNDLLEERREEYAFADDRGLVSGGSGWGFSVYLTQRGRAMIALNETWRPGVVIRMPPTWWERWKLRRRDRQGLLLRRG